MSIYILSGRELCIQTSPTDRWFRYFFDAINYYQFKFIVLVDLIFGVPRLMLVSRWPDTLPKNIYGTLKTGFWEVCYSKLWLSQKLYKAETFANTRWWRDNFSLWTFRFRHKHRLNDDYIGRIAFLRAHSSISHQPSTKRAVMSALANALGWKLRLGTVLYVFDWMALI